jgi:monoterpene epsilon-lactone hydrolase
MAKLDAVVNKTAVDAAIAKVQSIYGGWRRDTSMAQMRQDWDDAFWSDTLACDLEYVKAGAVSMQWLCACEDPGERVLLYVHGGGFKMGSLRSHHDFMARLSRAAACRVLGVDYRLVPEHRYPAALDDVTAAYQWLLDKGVSSDNICLAGDSAGGGLVASLLLALRDSDTPMPLAAVMLSALTDLTASGASYQTRADADPIHNQTLILALGKQYTTNEAELSNPLASPLFGELQGLPPLLIHVGDRETGLNDSTDFAEKAQLSGVDVELKVWGGMIHFFQQFSELLPEAEAALDDIAAFLTRHWSKS